MRKYINKYEEVYQQRKAELIEYKNSHGYPIHQKELVNLWNLSRQGVSVYLKNNNLQKYVQTKTTIETQNTQDPDNITNKILELRSKLGIVWRQDITDHKILTQPYHLTPEQEALLIPYQIYRSAIIINNHVKLLQTFEKLYERKANSQEAIQLLSFSSVATLTTKDIRSNNIYRKYYDKTPESDPAKIILTTAQLNNIKKLSNLRPFEK